MDSTAPLAVWDDATGPTTPAVARIAWADSRPSVFFVTDADARLHVWDLLANDRVRTTDSAATHRRHSLTVLLCCCAHRRR